MTVKGHGSRRWEKSPGVYENKRQASTVIVKDMAVDTGKKVW